MQTKNTAIIVVIFLNIYLTKAFAQNDSAINIKTFGYTDVYYAYNFSNPKSKQIPYAYNHNRNNEFNVNNIILGLKYTNNIIRSTIALHTGTYVQANYAPEPTIAQLINEATIGVQLTQKIGLDVGIMPSHIGLETAISKDNLTLTRSLSAENSPYYQSGIKLSANPSKKWFFATYVLNGWQNIEEKNSNKAVATQIQFSPNKNILLNYSTFIGEGRNNLDSLQLFRHFHDFYFTLAISEKISIASVFDIGFEEKTITANTSVSWITTALLIKYKIKPKISSCLRAEYVNDTNFILGLNEVAGFSLNFDYTLGNNIVFRVEGKTFPTQTNEGRFDNQSFLNSTITSSLAISF